MSRNTFTDFSQLSKGMFRSEPKPVEIKPQPKKKHTPGDDAAMAYFGLREAWPENAQNAPTTAPCESKDMARIKELEAENAALRRKCEAAETRLADAERKATELEQTLAAERKAREAAEAECTRLRTEVAKSQSEIEELATAPATPMVQVAHDPGKGMLKSPSLVEVFSGEAREHVLAALSEAFASARQSGRERRAAILEAVLAANAPSGELERRKAELKQIIKDTGDFIDERTLSALEAVGFKCVSGRKHWKLDYAGVRIPISKTPSDHRAAKNMATSIANMCF